MGDLPHILFPHQVREYIDRIRDQAERIETLEEDVRLLEIRVGNMKRTAQKAQDALRNGHDDSVRQFLTDILTEGRR